MGTGATSPRAVAAVLPDFQQRLLLSPSWPPLPQDYHHLLEARRSSNAPHHPMVVSSALPQGRIDQQSLNPSGSHWDLDWWRMLEMRNLKKNTHRRVSTSQMASLRPGDKIDTWGIHPGPSQGSWLVLAAFLSVCIHIASATIFHCGCFELPSQGTPTFWVARACHLAAEIL